MADVLKNIGKGLLTGLKVAGKVVLAVGAGALGFLGGTLGAVVLGGVLVIVAVSENDHHHHHHDKNNSLSTFFTGIGLIVLAPVGGVALGVYAATKILGIKVEDTLAYKKVTGLIWREDNQNNQVEPTVVAVNEITTPSLNSNNRNRENVVNDNMGDSSVSLTSLSSLTRNTPSYQAPDNPPPSYEAPDNPPSYEEATSGQTQKIVHGLKII